MNRNKGTTRLIDEVECWVFLGRRNMRDFGNDAQKGIEDGQFALENIDTGWKMYRLVCCSTERPRPTYFPRRHIRKGFA
jgi:hypothetical protein